MPDAYDFSGIATAYDVLCKDGRVIKNGAFDHQAGQVIPIVWRHGHDDIRNVLGHAQLAVNPQPPGMRVTATFNKTKEGQRAKHLVQNKDIKYLSIWANELIERSKSNGKGVIREVEHGTIREASLVLAGMNPGALIDDVVRHSDDPLDPDLVIADGVIIHTDLPISLYEVEEEEKEKENTEELEETVSHEEKETVESILATLTDEQQRLFDVVVHSAAIGEKVPPTRPNAKNGSGPTVQEVFDTLSDKQKNVLYYMVGEISQEDLSQGDPDPMTTHNIFEEEGRNENETVLIHEKINSALKSAASRRPNSLRELFLQNGISIDDLHTLSQSDPKFLAHSISNISNFFPDNKLVDPGGPQYFADREMTWVPRVLNGVRRVPWARLKSNYADLTADTARAKGYVTGAAKVEEVIDNLQRETNPQTVYKLQKLDRDNILDITDFDVVVWLKAEMRMMLQEEVARAVLISDGRSAGADKIVETNIRPIYNDAATYTISRIYNDVGNTKTFSSMTAAELIVLLDYIAESFDDYRGAGNPVFYCQPSLLTKLLTLRDSQDHRLHMNRADLADQLGVSDIVPIPPMNDMSRAGVVDPPGLPTGTYTIETLGVIVNLRDYAMGQDRGGEVNFFDDFDIDYNKYTYLYETRLSGALVNPKSAIAIENVTAKTA